MIIVALWAVAMILMNSLQCGTHISALWDGTDAFMLYCGRVQPYEQAFAISNALLDLWVITLPIPKIFSLQTTTARKFAVSGVFLLASVLVVAQGPATIDNYADCAQWSGIFHCPSGRYRSGVLRYVPPIPKYLSCHLHSLVNSVICCWR